MVVKKIRHEQIIPNHIQFEWTHYDDECDPALATIYTIDAFDKKCSHFIIGPMCEFSVCKQLINFKASFPLL
jgi:hypothetical protein